MQNGAQKLKEFMVHESRDICYLQILWIKHKCGIEADKARKTVIVSVT